MIPDPSVRSRTIRRYRLFVRVAGPMFLIGLIFVATGVIAAVVTSEYTLLLSGLSLAFMSAASLYRTLMGTVRIVEIEHMEAETGWRAL